jgi:hypothetical protein
MKETWKNRRREREENRILQEQQRILDSMLRSNASISYMDESKPHIDTKTDQEDEDDQFYNMIIKAEDYNETEKVIQDLTADGIINKNNDISMKEEGYVVN